MRLSIIAASLIVLVVPAQASIPDYCVAYARDIADQVPKSENWQRRHDDAQNSCIMRFTAFEATPEKAAPKPKPKPIASKPTLEKPKAEAKIETPPKTKTAAKVIPKLKAGSPEWTAYCKQKYVSFDESKGTYLSKTGIERKCLVTAD